MKCLQLSVFFYEKSKIYLLWSIRREVFTEPFGYNSGYRSKYIKEHWNKKVTLFWIHCIIIQLMANYTGAQLAYDSEKRHALETAT